MEKVNQIVSCKTNHIDETHLEFKAKNQSRNILSEPQKKKINYTVENAKLKNDIKELK